MFKSLEKIEAPYSFRYGHADGSTSIMELGRGLMFEPHAFFKWMARISRRQDTLWIKVEINQRLFTVWER